ncbi:DUF2804 domain-containing protein [Pseudomonas sp. NCCP-436]|uniref:DUF2804 domain-containing protein n=1 Tax=Pseudomonas sp. NCCP-436 TaxID=2842481 RepID=UPI001C801428|nr:DUF2804 domain-containing protein [Pseudomonas sp. NCCP-436]GIZ13263.1 hypothetical protein NCCP436_26790 [Pseudomonas sp. NCCP-436]
MTSLPRYATALLQPLCDSKGRLLPESVGWSDQLQVDCTLHGHQGRRKRWNHWCITTPRWILTLTLADLDYLGYGATYFLDLDSGQASSHSRFSLFASGCQLPGRPLQSHAFNHPRLQLKAEEHPGRLRLTVSIPDIGGQPLLAALDILRPAHLQSANLVAPLPDGGFHATSRWLGLTASGTLQLGRRNYHCPPGQSFASLDFGRGVWPLRSHWRRAVFTGCGGVAGNFSTGWLDYSGLSDNALWFGGQVHQLQSPLQLQRSSHAPLAPWCLESEDGSVTLRFTPRRIHRTCPRLGPLYADTLQWLGYYSGVLRGPNGERVPLENTLGWLGETHARW